ncbi:hypothetical protein N386_gp23 [Puniceispirillum phage HMO-2011]|uniref:hypothetical protein n=1 Tax=Puniceispirillum phage HMO-2011 TaxID=948071 RepID=UPI000351A14B|nr:hypothetical protein N386_gp23 [Puniceispirillum phage HMO-2011]ADW08408.1 hypothetical protein phage1322_23 [Puniceispirillum phage HMO-2011]
MSFFEGIITGAATSIDAQLKKDMERTQERAEGMAQYRVTRRRTEIERQNKEKKEISDVMSQLASLVDGDIDKAAQLYTAGGKTIEGAKNLYAELDKNRKAGKDISTALTFAESQAEPGQLTDYVSQFITPISALPVAEGEMKASGLYGALFKPDLSKQILRDVEEQAPLPTAIEAARDIKGATIDRSGFLAAEEAAEMKLIRERAAGSYGREVAKFGMDMKQAEQSMQLALKREKRAEEVQKSDATQQEKDNARADATLAMQKARLNIATAQAAREAKAFVGEQELQGLTIETRKAELDKIKNAPEYATYERMMVHADEQLAVELAKPEQNTQLINELKAQRQYGIDGIKSVASAETDSTYTPSFSKQSVDSIINSEIKRQLQPVGLVKDIEGQLDYMIEGNEVQYFDRMARALNNVEQRVSGIDDAQMNNTIKAQRESLRSDKNVYIKKQIDSGITPVTANSAQDAADKNFTSQLEPGAIVEYKNRQGATVARIWTGSRYI